jgi:hypothetical protein
MSRIAIALLIYHRHKPTDLIKQYALKAKAKNLLGHDVDQAISRRLPTAAALVRARVRSCGICGGQNGTGAEFLLVLGFPLPIIPPTAPHSSSSIIIRGWCNMPISGLSNSGFGFTPPHRKKSSQSEFRTRRKGVIRFNILNLWP